MGGQCLLVLISLKVLVMMNSLQNIVISGAQGLLMLMGSKFLIKITRPQNNVFYHIYVSNKIYILEVSSIILENTPIMLALCFMLSSPHLASNYVDMIDMSLSITVSMCSYILHDSSVVAFLPNDLTVAGFGILSPFSSLTVIMKTTNLL